MSGFDVWRGMQVWEKTPSYLDVVDPSVVFDFFPTIKLAVILRDPADRLYSGFWHDCRQTTQPLLPGNCSFDRLKQSLAYVASISDMATMPNKSRDWTIERHVLMGFYHRFLSKWIDAFAKVPKSSLPMLVMFSESFKSDPFHTLDVYQDFLGLERKFDFKARAKQLPNGLYVLGKGKGSKTFRKKPPGYMPMPPELHDEIVKLLLESFV